MLEIAIWGVAFMLIVKGLDIAHQQRLAEVAGSKGAPLVSGIAVVLALIFAVVLFVSSTDQASHTSTPASFGTP